MTNCISTAAAAGALGSIINASAPHAEERMVCVTLPWREMDSNLQYRGKIGSSFEALVALGEGRVPAGCPAGRLRICPGGQSRATQRTREVGGVDRW